MKLFFISVFVSAASVVGAQSGVRLLPEATVVREDIRLCDLLPADASTAARNAAQTVLLGRSPEPGSLRVFSAYEILKMAGGAHFEIPQEVVVRGAGWPLDLAMVRDAVERSAAARFDLSRARIVPPPSFTTRVPRARLEAVSIRADLPRGALLATLRCASRADCGSFLTQIFLSSGMPEIKAHTLQGSAVSGKETSRGHSAASDSRAFLVQPGKTALLVIEEDGLTITEPVLPERRGTLGEVLRVEDRATHRPLLAEVTAEGRLRPAQARLREGTR